MSRKQFKRSLEFMHPLRDGLVFDAGRVPPELQVMAGPFQRIAAGLQSFCYRQLSLFLVWPHYSAISLHSILTITFFDCIASHQLILSPSLNKREPSIELMRKPQGVMEVLAENVPAD